MSDPASEAPRLPDAYAARSGDLEIRSAAGGDFDEVAALLAHLVADDPHPAPVAAGPFERALADPRRLLLVAGRAGALVGTLDLILVDNPTHAGAPWACLENVVVAPAARRSGVGRALVESALDLARAAGAYKVQLLSGAGRTEAHALYEAAGFDAPVRGFRRYL